MKRQIARTCLVAALALPATTAPAVAQPSVDAGFAPVRPRVVDRPATLIETNSYVYGPGIVTSPEIRLTLEDNSFDESVTLFVYWHDRGDGSLLFLNARVGLSAKEVDFFGDPADARGPRQIKLRDLDGFKLFGPGSAFGGFSSFLPTATGRYQFVLEIRDPVGREVIARSNSAFNFVDAVVTRRGEISASERWTADNAYFLPEPVRVSAGTLEIEPGTVILGSAAISDRVGSLLIGPDAAIKAVGKPLDPIVFTSSELGGGRRPGDWGGLIVNGEASTNRGVNPRPEGQGGSGPFGGSDDNDSSGALNYVRVEFGGAGGLDALGLQGVGRGTVLEHVQVHRSLGDGVGVFGGTVDSRYLLVTGAEEDSLDWTAGWRGRLQNLVAIQCAGFDPGSALEGDNADSDDDVEPVSDPTIRNVTLVGNSSSDSASSSDGVVLSGGTRGLVANALVFGFPDLGFGVFGSTSQGFLTGKGIALTDSILFANGRDSNVALEELTGPLFFDDPGFFSPPPRRAGCGLVPDVTFANRHEAGSRGAGFFDPNPFIGGVDDDDPWIDDGWTSFAND